MGPLAAADFAKGALLLPDSAPITYVLENHRVFAPRFLPLFEAHAAGQLRFAVTSIGMTEVLTGPLRSSNEALMRRFRTVMESWQVVPLDSAIAESAARMRTTLHLKLADTVQLASALSIAAGAVVTHDRDFSAVTAIRVIS